MQREQLVRINKYLADKKYCTRNEADEFIEQGRISINGRKAVLGDKVAPTDTVTVRLPKKTYLYFAYHKPRGIITHSPQRGEKEIAQVVALKGVFPVGRLDKDSSGLILLTNDGRLTDALLNPAHEHEKEYEVKVSKQLPNNFKRRMEKGVFIGDCTTKPCKVSVRGEKNFSIILTEGKKHQIRRMCDALGQSVVELKRVRILNIKLDNLNPGAYRALAGAELQRFLSHVQLL